jgi:membrane associated rhomboid family serine protease
MLRPETAGGQSRKTPGGTTEAGRVRKVTARQATVAASGGRWSSSQSFVTSPGAQTARTKVPSRPEMDPGVRCLLEHDDPERTRAKRSQRPRSPVDVDAGSVTCPRTGVVMPSVADLRAAIATAPMSAVLIGVNLTVFIAVTIDGRLMDVLALPPDRSGLLEQPWTVFTVFFTAEALIHIVAAVFVIGLFGARFERIAGARPVLGVYLLAGLAGSLALAATAVVTGFDEPSNGASVAFFGLMAALATCSREAWGAKLHVEKVLAVVVVSQLVPIAGIGDWVSSAAHLAGIGVGAAYGSLLRTPATEQQRRESIDA